jgi:site-specific DNA-cytosine methylase
MKILVACEESQAVTIELRKLGHEAYSCDIEPCSGGHPEWHLQQDVIPLLKEKWDVIIAFPPCTYLTNAGTRHFSRRINPDWKVDAREKLREEAFEFFMLFANADCDKIAIENPVGYVNSHYRKPDQIIHPYYFGDNAQKRTCLWLKGLPKLESTNMLPKPEPQYMCQGELSKGKPIGWREGIKGTTGGQKGRAKARSKTFPGIAKAMAEQWGGLRR